MKIKTPLHRESIPNEAGFGFNYTLHFLVAVIVIMTGFIAVMIVVGIMVIADIMIIVAVVVISLHVGLHIRLHLAPQRYVVTVGVIAKFLVPYGMVAPVRMASLPAVEALQPDRIARDPDVAGSQIEIIRTDDPYVFISVPDIGIRHAGCHCHRRCRCDHDRRRGCHDDGWRHDYRRWHRYGRWRGYG